VSWWSTKVRQTARHLFGRVSDDERAELVESWKGDGGHNGNGRREKPHSRPLYESAGGSDVPKTTEDFVEAIT